MGGLRRISDSRFMNDKQQAANSARKQLDYILANKHVLMTTPKDKKKAMAADDMAALQPEDLTPGQRSYIDGIYETVWERLKYPSVNQHIDKKRRGAGL